MALKNLSHSIQTRIKKIPNIYAHTRLMSFENNGSLLREALNHKLQIDIKLVLPESCHLRNFQVSSKFSQINVEILGNIHKIKVVQSHFTPDTQLVYLKINTIDSQGASVIHKLKGSPNGPSLSRLLKMQVGDLVLIHGDILFKRQKVTYQDILQYSYPSPLTIFSAFKLGRTGLQLKNTYSSVTMLGKVVGRYIAIQGTNYVGHIDLITWRNRSESKNTHVQTNRIMIPNKILKTFPYLENVNPGDTLMVNGSIDYITHPEVLGSLLVLTAKEVIRLASVGSRYRSQEVNAGKIST